MMRLRTIDAVVGIPRAKKRCELAMKVILLTGLVAAAHGFNAVPLRGREGRRVSAEAALFRCHRLHMGVEYDKTREGEYPHPSDSGKACHPTLCHCLC